MKRFKSAGQAQRFLSVHDQVANLFRRPAHTNAEDHRRVRAQAFQVWAEVTGIASAACLSSQGALCLQFVKLTVPPRVPVTDKLGSYGAATARSCRALNIGRVAISTTAARSRTSPLDSANAT